MIILIWSFGAMDTQINVKEFDNAYLAEKFVNTNVVKAEDYKILHCFEVRRSYEFREEKVVTQMKIV